MEILWGLTEIKQGKVLSQNWPIHYMVTLALIVGIFITAMCESPAITEQLPWTQGPHALRLP